MKKSTNILSKIVVYVIRLTQKDYFVVFTKSGFQSAMLCPNLTMVHPKRSLHALTQGIRTIEIYIEYKQWCC